MAQESLATKLCYLPNLGENYSTCYHIVHNLMLAHLSALCIDCIFSTSVSSGPSTEPYIQEQAWLLPLTRPVALGDSFKLSEPWLIHPQAICEGLVR